MLSSLLDLSGVEHVSDANRLAIALVALAACVLWLGLGAWRHRRNLLRVPLRIHVAGTRGKSTTTRLIAAGLRAGGHRVLAKSTGSAPRLILPDGSEQDWPRRGPAAVREQVRFFAEAARRGCDAAVVECMAIRPELIWASENHLVRAATAVITNARPDHLEEVGSDAGAAGEALRWVCPPGGRLVVAAEAVSPALRAWAAGQRTQLEVVDTGAMMPSAANRALALAVCAAHGVPADIAGPAMVEAIADPAAAFERPFDVAGKRLRFFNAFSCNDVESLALLWRGVTQPQTPVVVLNARRDRPLRTRHFLQYLAQATPAPLLFVIGDPLALRLARRAGFAAGRVHALRHSDPAAALRELASPAAPGAVIWGVGNYHGFGAKLVAALAEPRAGC